MPSRIPTRCSDATRRGDRFSRLLGQRIVLLGSRSTHVGAAQLAGSGPATPRRQHVVNSPSGEAYAPIYDTMQHIRCDVRDHPAGRRCRWAPSSSPGTAGKRMALPSRSIDPRRAPTGPRSGHRHRDRRRAPLGGGGHDEALAPPQPASRAPRSIGRCATATSRPTTRAPVRNRPRRPGACPPDGGSRITVSAAPSDGRCDQTSRSARRRRTRSSSGGCVGNRPDRPRCRAGWRCRAMPPRG